MFLFFHEYYVRHAVRWPAFILVGKNEHLLSLGFNKIAGSGKVAESHELSSRSQQPNHVKQTKMQESYSNRVALFGNACLLL